MYDLLFLHSFARTSSFPFESEWEGKADGEFGRVVGLLSYLLASPRGLATVSTMGVGSWCFRSLRFRSVVYSFRLDV